MKSIVFSLMSFSLFFLSSTNPLDFGTKTLPAEMTICKTTAADLTTADLITAIPFDNNFVKPMAVMVRKNVYSLTAAEITSIKTGIAAMKALPLTNPTSWTYQAAIHGTTLANNLPAWKSCQHGTQFFLSWHRMYLYYFERILRKKSGNPNLTLPYWNYQTNPVLHPSYRSNVPGNTLFHTRNASINGGGSLPAGIMVSINNSLNNIPFFTFNTTLEGPHGSVHGAIGGDMGAVPTAAKDPVFWLHHANIDRLWEQWLRKCQGRANPVAGPWMTQIFKFFDENGVAVNMTGSQIVNTATQLNYRYDFPPMVPCGAVIANVDSWKWKTLKPLRIEGITNFANNRAKVSFTKSKTDVFDKMVNENNIGVMNVSSTDISDIFLLEIEDIKASKLPEGIVEVYLNLPANAKPSSSSKSFVGVLDLFSAASHESHGGKHPVSIDATTAIRSLGLKTQDFKKAELSFVVRGNTLNGKEINTQSTIQLGAVNFVIQQAQN